MTSSAKCAGDKNSIMVKKKIAGKKPAASASGQGNSPLKLGFLGLTALTFGMMVGSGIFDLPQNFAKGAGLGAVAVAWVITAAGMLLLVGSLKTLADRRPDLSAGIYQYAQEGFGNYLGFNSAWGYWLCASFANVTYAVMLNDSFGAFFPSLLNHGWEFLIFGTVLIWTMFGLVAMGVQTAKKLNNFLAALKVTVIVTIVVLLFLNVKYGMLSYEFLSSFTDFSDLATQIKSTMLITVYCFIGIEGAVMMSARAKKPKDVGKAGVVGFFGAWILYVLVSMLSYGIMHRPELAHLDNPSVAYVLQTVCGEWAYYFVIASVIISLLGGWLSWTFITAQVPLEAAKTKILPKSFERLNGKQMPAFGLFVSSVIMQLYLVTVTTADNVYLMSLNITSMMILPCYLFCGMFLWKASLHPALLNNPSRKKRLRFLLTGIFCTIYCVWMLYSAGLFMLMLSSVFYIIGVPIYIKARRENLSADRQKHGWLSLFSTGEKWLLAGLTVCAVISIAMIATGHTELP